jgi:hypothetical protein
MPLPQSILEMAAVIGLPAALALVKSYGGLELRVPIGRVVESKGRSDLIALIGPDAADRLILAYGGERLTIPRCASALRDQRDREILAAYDAGESSRKLCKTYSMTDRNLRYILKRVIPPSEFEPLPVTKETL